MAGDYYQKLQFNDEEEEIDDDIIDSYESTDFYIGKYNFQKIVFDRNYRNSALLVKTLNKMLNRIQSYIKMLGLKVNDEELRFNIGNAIRIGKELPKYIRADSEKEEAKIIIDNIMTLLNKKLYTQNEILLVSPWGEKSNIINYVEKELRNRGIEICNFRDSNLKKDGIRIGTIGKSIGLDFKAVIIFGTKMLKKSREEEFEFKDLEILRNSQRSIKAEFIRFLKNIYVACSRARDTLIVVDDIKEESLISDFLKIIGE
jgi:superfamily I DNA/RNA helicase